MLSLKISNIALTPDFAITIVLSRGSVSHRSDQTS